MTTPWLAKVAESRHHSTVAGRIRAREQQAAGGDELALEPHVMLQLLRVGRGPLRRHRVGSITQVEIGLTRLRCERLHSPRP